MNVELPNGVVVEDVPDGMSQADLIAKLGRNGYDISWYKPVEPDRFSQEAMTERIKTAFGSAAAIPETAAAMGSGIVASVFGGLAGLGAAPFVGADKAADIVRRIQGGMTYQPRTEVGRAVTSAVAAPFEMANKGLGMIGGAAGEALGGEKGRFAGEAVGESVVPVLGTLAGYKPMVNAANTIAQARQVANASKIIEQTQQNLPKIDAAKDAQRLGLVIDPSEVNPTLKNKALTTWAGRKQTDIRASELNLPKIIEVLKKEAGVTDPKLNSATLKAAREQISQPYMEMRSVGDLAPNKTIADTVRASAPEEITGAEAAVRGATRITNRLADRIESGDFSGNSAVNHINYYRQNAKRLYNKTDASEADLAKARVYENSAKQLESLLEANITDPALLTAFRSARQQLAKNFTVDDIINNQSGIPNLSKLNTGKLADAPLEGDLAALRNIQANLPEVVAPVSKYGEVITHLSRTSPSGSAGAAVGLTMGQPTAGGLAGAITGLLGGRLIRGRVLSPSYQAANVMPKMTSLMSQIPERAPSTSIVPFVSQGEQISASHIPNWRFGTPGVDPNPVFIPSTGDRLLGFTPNAEMIRPREWANRSQTLEQEAAIREAASPRQPASGGVLYEIDPITGKLHAADQGVKGATFSTVVSTGNDLSSAVKKLASGSNFALSAEERISWNKRRVELEQSTPEFRGVSDATIAEKISNRAWVENRIKELKSEYADWAKNSAERFRADRVAELNEMSNTRRIMGAKERQARKTENARAARELNMKLNQRKAEIQSQIDTLEEMSDVTKQRSIYVGQGPKTRGAQRGLLTGEQQ